MSNEKIQAGLDKYNASVEKAVSRFPERPHLPEQRLYTPLDIKDTDYAEEIGFPGMYHILVAYSLPCTEDVSGPCVCMQASPLLLSPTSVIVI